MSSIAQLFADFLSYMASNDVDRMLVSFLALQQSHGYEATYRFHLPALIEQRADYNQYRPSSHPLYKELMATTTMSSAERDASLRDISQGFEAFEYVPLKPHLHFLAMGQFVLLDTSTEHFISLPVLLAVGMCARHRDARLGGVQTYEVAKLAAACVEEIAKESFPPGSDLPKLYAARILERRLPRPTRPFPAVEHSVHDKWGCLLDHVRFTAAPHRRPSHLPAARSYHHQQPIFASAAAQFASRDASQASSRASRKRNRDMLFAAAAPLPVVAPVESAHVPAVAPVSPEPAPVFQYLTSPADALVPVPPGSWIISDYGLPKKPRRNAVALFAKMFPTPAVAPLGQELFERCFPSLA